jgi:hypothetical protein
MTTTPTTEGLDIRDARHMLEEMGIIIDYTNREEERAKGWTELEHMLKLMKERNTMDFVECKSCGATPAKNFHRLTWFQHAHCNNPEHDHADNDIPPVFLCDKCHEKVNRICDDVNKNSNPKQRVEFK